MHGDRHHPEVVMFSPKARVLLILPQPVLDRARALSGRLTATLRLPVSLQIVLRVLIEDGMARAQDRGFTAKVEHQAREVRRIRRGARVRERREALRAERSATSRPLRGEGPIRRRGT